MFLWKSSHFTDFKTNFEINKTAAFFTKNLKYKCLDFADRTFILKTNGLCYRKLLKEVKKAGEIHIVLDCSTEKIQSILKQASQVGMMTAYHNYLITSLVSYTVSRKS